MGKRIIFLFYVCVALSTTTPPQVMMHTTITTSNDANITNTKVLLLAQAVISEQSFSVHLPSKLRAAAFI